MKNNCSFRKIECQKAKVSKYRNYVNAGSCEDSEVNTGIDVIRYCARSRVSILLSSNRQINTKILSESGGGCESIGCSLGENFDYKTWQFSDCGPIHKVRIVFPDEVKRVDDEARFLVLQKGIDILMTRGLEMAKEGFEFILKSEDEGVREVASFFVNWLSLEDGFLTSIIEMTKSINALNQRDLTYIVSHYLYAQITSFQSIPEDDLKMKLSHDYFQADDLLIDLVKFKNAAEMVHEAFVNSENPALEEIAGFFKVLANWAEEYISSC